ncbi:MAG: hypothetical protein ACRC7C_12460 [Beijerinckiaceae bacterium]
MYETIERLASISVARGVGFGALAVFCFMISFAGDTANMLRAGGMGALCIAMVLWTKAANASARNFKQSEVWIMLDRDKRPPEALAAGMVTEARKLVLTRWSHRAAVAAAAQLGGAVIWALAGLV